MRSTERAVELLKRETRHAVLSGSGFRGVTSMLGERLGGAVVIGRNSGTNGPSPQVVDAYGISAATLRAYGDHFYRISPWRAWIDSARRNTVSGGAAVNALDESSYEKSEFYADFLRPNDLHHGLGARIDQTGGLNIDLAVLRPRQGGPIDADELVLIRRLIPALRGALRARRLFAAAGASPFGADAKGMGMLLVDHRARVLFANDTGDALLFDGSAITARSGRLGTPRPAAEERLHALLRRIGHDVPREILLPRKHARPLRATLVPVPSGEDRFGLLEPACLILLRDHVPAAARSGTDGTLHLPPI